MPNILGIVTNAATQKPLAHAFVWVDLPVPNLSPNATTADDGSFELHGLAPGIYTLRAQTTPIQIGRVEYPFFGVLENVHLTDTDISCNIAVRVEGILRGVVKDSLAGKPIRGARIQTAEDTGGLYLCISDEEGLFSLGHIRPQSYNVVAEALGYDKFHQRVFVGDALEDGPVSLPVFLTPSPIPLSAGGVVKGFALNEMGNPAVGAEITLTGKHELRSMVTFKDYFDLENGNYEFFNIPEGHYWVTVLKAGMYPGKAEVTVQRGKVNWTPDIRLVSLPVHVPPEIEYLVIEPRILTVGQPVKVRLRFKGSWARSAVASATIFGPGGLSVGFSLDRDEREEELSTTFSQWTQPGTFVLSQLLVFDTDTGKAFQLNVQAQFEVVPNRIPPLTPESPIFSVNR
jgi:hypothetical protein